MFSHTSSELYDQRTFYKAFLHDLRNAKTRVIIESPFITEKRMKLLFPTLRLLSCKGVRIIVNTKPLEEHTSSYQSQAIQAISIMQDLGIEMLRTVGHHRKLAIIDEDVLWEGSLNILSQNDSCEVMRRIRSSEDVKKILAFINMNRWYK